MTDRLSAPDVRRYAESTIPTDHGSLEVVVYREHTDGQPAVEHLAIVKGDLVGAEDVLVRVHSECFTGEVLHSLMCDCREQLDLALGRISHAGRGAVIYLRQEGRGIGLGNKIRAYALQERGFDTVDANRMLGFDDDSREYDIAAAMLADLGIRSVALMTNNPAKVRALEADGVVITRRVAHVVPHHAHNRGYLDTKRARMGHLYDAEAGDGTGEHRKPAAVGGADALVERFRKTPGAAHED
jgi:GTP cyclohydrolase II/3,4-dihydroxy 2-butanone 4-phosphate synthase/GTP cyclohydrolase II